MDLKKTVSGLIAEIRKADRRNRRLMQHLTEEVRYLLDKEDLDGDDRETLQSVSRELPRMPENNPGPEFKRLLQQVQMMLDAAAERFAKSGSLAGALLKKHNRKLQQVELLLQRLEKAKGVNVAVLKKHRRRIAGLREAQQKQEQAAIVANPIVDRDIERSCLSKKRFPTSAEAYAAMKKGVYKCPHCGQWHATSRGKTPRRLKSD